MTYEEIWEFTRWRALDLIPAKITHFTSVDLEAMELYIEVEIEDCPEKVWWEEMEERYGDG